MKNRSYEDSVHFYGRIWTVTALFVMFCIPISICIYFNVWPKATKVLEGLLPVAMLFYPSAIIEVLTYGPMLGSGGTYLSFVTGNISNLKLPCALNSMENAKVRATSEEGDVISTISIATSSIVTTLIIALGVVAFSPVLPYITDPTPHLHRLFSRWFRRSSVRWAQPILQNIGRFRSCRLRWCSLYCSLRAIRQLAC